jgi:flagellar hook assembly protein FlgD
VQPGDANPEVLTNALRVLTSAASAGSLVSSLALSSPVFTPNGDGVNDQLELNYSLLQLVKPVGVEVAIYDLAGRRVRTLLDANSTSGAYAVTWNGRDDQRQVVPPGIYVAVIQVHTERETFVRTSSMGVAY